MAIFNGSTGNISVVVGGFAITGFVDAEDSVQLDILNAREEKTEGLNGDITYYAQPCNKNITLKIKLTASSADNDTLSTLRIAHENSNGIAYPVTVSVLGTNTKYISPKCLIEPMPAVVLGNSGTAEREWTITMNQAEKFVGGLTTI